MKVFLEVFLIRLIFEFIREPIISFVLLINVFAQFLDTDLKFFADNIIIETDLLRMISALKASNTRLLKETRLVVLVSTILLNIFLRHSSIITFIIIKHN